MPASDKPKQIPFDLGHRPGHSREELVVSDANRQAVDLIDAWPNWPATVVVLAGPAGCGKTHLAAIWAARADAVSVEPAAIERHLQDAPLTRPVVIDDADADLDEHGLFHLINAARAAGTHVLLTSRLFPSAWGVKLPDLASRLKAAATVEILEPDDHLLAAVITKLFADRQVEVEPHVVQFLVRRIERSLSTAIDIVDRLDRAALEQKSRITRVLAAQTVNALDRGQTQFDLDDGD
ncbi:MAG TPA: DnaA regulatory inactivator HdaA [Rhizobiaceae bacterium]